MKPDASVSAGSAGEGSLVPSYDESRWPVVVVKMPAAPMPTPLFMAHLDRCSSYHDRGGPFCMLIDMGRHPALSALQRNLVGARVKEDVRRHPDLLKATAIIVQSVFERGVVTAINWIAQPPSPFRAFANTAEAWAWLSEFLPPGKAAPAPR